MATPAPYGALFPGQGSQYPGMARVLVDEFSWTRAIYEEASDAIQENLLRLCLDGPEDRLQLTQNAQPAILATSHAWFQVLRRTLDFSPAAGAGHSLGEYTALLCAGSLELATAVRLVRKRGELMQAAVPAGKGRMAALIGPTEDQVKRLCEQASQGETSIVVPANYNGPGQTVIAGHAEAVQRAEKLAGPEGDPSLKARKVVPLKVSAPFHSPLMHPAADAFQPYLTAVRWAERAFPIVHNLDATWRTSGDLPPLLRDQIDHPVLWTQCQAELGRRGLGLFVETGPGKVLSGLGKRILEGARFHSVDGLDALRDLETLFKEQAK